MRRAARRRSDAVGGEVATVSGATWAEGKLGGALHFDGKSASVAIADREDLRVGGEMTMAAWIRPERIPQGITFMNVLVHGSASGKGEKYLRLSNGQFAVGDFAGVHDPTEKGVPPDDAGQWFHLAGVYDGESWHIYRNGELFHSHKTTHGPRAFAGPWAIGASPNGKERFFQGDIDDVRIYKRGLSADEVRALYLGKSSAASVPRIAAGRARQGPRRALEVRRRRRNGARTTLRGSTTARCAGAAWTAGIRGRALSFDGVDDSVRIENGDDLNFAGPITIAAWTRLAHPRYGWIGNIISHGRTDNPPRRDVFAAAILG